ncbi:MAG: class I SAM-dependent DNA methyltransferase [Butyrivibrio sp.]
MKEYTAFAKVYDSFMADIPYREWADGVDAFLKQKKTGNTVLEIGCGTGSFAFIMEEKGYKVKGVDSSPDMLKVARKKAGKLKSGVEFELQDMRVLEAGESVDVVISICDTMNYLRNEFDLRSVFVGVMDILKPGGIFLFDMKTESFYETLGENTFSDETEAGEYIWNNYYDKDARDNYYEMKFYIHKKNNLYIKHEEEHIQHAFTADEIRKNAEECGFNITEVLGKGLAVPADFGAERVYYILERK